MDIGGRLSAADDLRLYRELHDAEVLERRPFYNVGAGSFRHPFWTNVDHPSAWYEGHQDRSSMIAWDMLALEPLPIGDGEAQVVYTSHALEHVTDAAAANLFRESHRLLAPGGWLRVTMPDMQLAYRAYEEADRHFFATFAMPKGAPPVAEVPLHELFLARFATSATHLWSGQGQAARIEREEFESVFAAESFETAMDHCSARASMEIQRDNPGNHVNWWTADKAARFMREAGFSDIRVSGYGQSGCPILRNTHFFDSTRPTISMYVEARRS